MKVTKIVREFVEEEVNKKYPMPEPDKVGMAQLDNDINDAKERIKKEAGEFIFNKMKEAGIVIDEKMVSIKVVDWRYFDKNGVSYYNGTVNALRAAYEEVSNEVKAKRETALKNILVSLELGGTKKELMEMLANLPD